MSSRIDNLNKLKIRVLNELLGPIGNSPDLIKKESVEDRILRIAKEMNITELDSLEKCELHSPASWLRRVLPALKKAGIDKIPEEIEIPPNQPLTQNIIIASVKTKAIEDDGSLGNTTKTRKEIMERLRARKSGRLE